MKVGVITFPGSNCDRDMLVAFKKLTNNVVRIWHKDTELPSGLDIIAIPGGFSYGDYLRCGALAGNSNIMKEVIKFGADGGFILGVCNGFQILTETGVLPGVLLRNKNLKFISKNIDLEISNKDTKFTNKFKKNKISIPIAHHDGNYFCTDDALKELEDNNQIAFTYTNTPNGAKSNIAGIYNKRKTILGLMPHPERSVDSKVVGGDDGIKLFESLLG